MTKIKKITFNYYEPTHEEGEFWETAEVGKELQLFETPNPAQRTDFGVVTCIRQHRAMGECDKWYYDIVLESGQVVRTFKPHFVIFEELETGD